MFKKFIRRRYSRATFVITACLLLFAGTGLARVHNLHGGGGWLMPIGLVTLACVRWRNAATIVCLAVLFGVLGWWRGSVLVQQLAPYTALAHHKIVVVGRATDDAVYDTHSQLVFGLDNVQVAAPYHAALPGSLGIKGFGASAVYRGDIVQVSGSLYPTRGNHQASMSFATLRVLQSKPSVIDVVRQKFAAGLQSALPEPQASFGLGLLIGQRSTLPDRVAQALVMVGLTHIIAVSGYNLTIMVEVARRVFGKRSKFQTAAACLLLIAVFLLITGSSPSIVRASIISTLGIAAWYYGRVIKPLVLLLVAAAMTVSANPLYLWGNVSWYLSFLAFFGVVVLAPLVTQRVYGERQPRLVMQIIIESLCAEAMTLPYVLFIFGQMSLVSLPANLLIAVLVPAAMLLTLVAGLAGMALPMLAGWFAWPAKLLLGYMLDVATLLSRVPHAFVEHIGFSFGMLIATYILVLLTATMLQNRARRKYAIITEKTTSS